MKKVFYWCPFITEVATVKAVINSCKGLIKYNKSYKPYIINCFGEFDQFRDKIYEDKIEIINLASNNFIKKISSQGFLLSRIKYIIIFLISFKKLQNLIKKENPDFFIAHLITSLPLILFKINNFRTKLILRISGLPKFNLFRYYLWKLCSNKINFITTPTEGTYLNILKLNLFKKEKLITLEDPIINSNEIFLKRKLKLNNEYTKKDEYIVAIGRLTEQKNFTLLINFFKSIEKEEMNTNLIIIGTGEQKEKLKQMIKKLNLEKRVLLLGYQDNVYKFLFNCKLFILSSKWEDPGFVLIEAAVCRSLILSSNCPNGPKEFLKNGVGGYLFKNNNLIDLIEKYRILQKDDYFVNKQKKISSLRKSRIYTVFNHTSRLSSILDKLDQPIKSL